MKRRNFLKGIVAGVTVGPSAVKASLIPVEKKPVPVPEIPQPKKIHFPVYLGLVDSQREEIVGKGYKRIELNNWIEAEPGSRTLIYQGDVEFHPTGPWDDIYWFAFYREPTGLQVRAMKPLGVGSRGLLAGDTLIIQNIQIHDWQDRI